MASVQHFNPIQQPQVQLTEAAVKHFQKTAREHPGQFIILDVKKTGCSGFSYATHLESALDHTHCPIPESHGLPIFMTEKAKPLLNGITIDYQALALGQKGLIYTNPNETGRCGCGESFTIDPKFLDANQSIQGDEDA